MEPIVNPKCLDTILSIANKLRHPDENFPKFFNHLMTVAANSNFNYRYDFDKYIMRSYKQHYTFTYYDIFLDRVVQQTSYSYSNTQKSLIPTAKDSKSFCLEFRNIVLKTIEGKDDDSRKTILDDIFNDVTSIQLSTIIFFQIANQDEWDDFMKTLYTAKCKHYEKLDHLSLEHHWFDEILANPVLEKYYLNNTVPTGSIIDIVDAATYEHYRRISQAYSGMAELRNKFYEIEARDINQNKNTNTTEL